jgi:formylglycine-generating enzyme required for sulfatase activity
MLVEASSWRLPASRWGFYQMHGNVWEWCDDFFSEWFYWSADSEKQNPVNVVQPAGRIVGRVVRGGSWYTFAPDCRSATRTSVEPTNGSWYDGFRLAALPVEAQQAESE